MYELIGEVSGYRSDEDEESVVATFDTKKLANAYADSARLKTPVTYSRYRPDRYFKVRSLLNGCDKCRIEKYVAPEVVKPPHNPT